MTAIESEWVAELAGRELPKFRPCDYRRVAVVAAHPDDETLGASGCIQALHEAGCDIRLIVASDGEAAFPALGPKDRAELGRRRRREMVDALRAQGLEHIGVEWLGLPDSGLADRAAELEKKLRGLLAGVDCVLSPWRGDMHPDHRAVAQATLRVAPVGAHRWAYPIWMWHWMRHGDDVVPWNHAYRYDVTDQQRARKSAAVREFRSQLVNGPDGSPPILPADVLEHFDRDCEVLFREPRSEGAPVGRFAELYQQARDPWQTETKWYEKRKRGLLLASLPRARYRRVVEPACGIGTMTAGLADRCDRIEAFDAVPAAAKMAADRLAPVSHAHVEVASLPEGMPAGPFDLVVLSEILYYLSDADFSKTLDAVTDGLEPGGDIVAVHWKPWAPEAARDGRAAHAALARRPELRTIVDHIDEEFVLIVLRRL
jgi:LmbE family N-acetylglucosaminyl deacetylase